MAQELIAAARLPGLSVAIAKDGQVVFAEGFGFADLHASRKVTPETRFRAASVSKVIAVTALATLLESGALTSDSQVDDYVPGYPQGRGALTVRHLAAHLGGVPHYSDQDRIERRFYSSVNDALSVFMHIPLLWEPGARYEYSTHGYTLLSAVIEGAAGRPYLEYLNEKVLEPLGMDSTGPELRARPDANAASLYNLRDGVVTEVTNPEDPSYKWAGGGMLSTPTDLVRMGNAYLGGWLERDIVRTMFERQRLASGEVLAIGFGWRHSFDMQGRSVMEHAGGMEGARSVLTLFPEQRLVIAVMVNASWPSSIEETAHLLAYPFLAPTLPAMPRHESPVEYGIELTLREDPDKPERARAKLQLDDDSGALSYVSHERVIRSPIVHLHHGKVYALVRPDGLFHLAMDVGDSTIRGQVTKYWSMRETPTSGGTTLMSFESVGISPYAHALP